LFAIQQFYGPWEIIFLPISVVAVLRNKFPVVATIFMANGHNPFDGKVLATEQNLSKNDPAPAHHILVMSQRCWSASNHYLDELSLFEAELLFDEAVKRHLEPRVNAVNADCPRLWILYNRIQNPLFPCCKPTFLHFASPFQGSTLCALQLAHQILI
jgi:hypothetical protein